MNSIVMGRVTLRLAAVASAVVLSSASAHADGLLQRLPVDGTWVRFEIATQNYDIRTGAPLGKHRTDSLTLRSVGKVTVDGEALRFIELSFRSKGLGPDGGESQDEILNVWKLLIPETRAMADQSPLDHVRRGWIKLSASPRDAGMPAMTQREFDPANETNYRYRLRVELPDPLKDSHKLEVQTIDCKLGKFSCAGVAGTDGGHWPSAKGPATQFEYETHLHDDVPFGVVRHRCDMKRFLAGGKLATHQVRTYTLAETGTNATSEIPEDLDPERAFRLLTSAEKLLAERKFDEAAAEFTRSLAFAPSFAAAHNGRGQALARQGDYPAAIAEFHEAMRRDPKYPHAPNDLAWLLATCPDKAHRDGKQAITHATRACELSEWKNTAFLGTLAAAYAEAGDFDAAVKWQTRAGELAPPEEHPGFDEKLVLFKAGQPFREVLKK
jgi:hypothetical protein